MREDLQREKEMKDLGWEVERSGDPGEPLKFRKRNKVIWLTSNGWCHARLENGHYVGHCYYKSLLLAQIEN
jgi:hypothetical protein